MLGHMTRMKVLFEKDGHDGDYLKHLGELAGIFSDLYGEFSRVGRTKAMESLSDLFQIQILEENAEVFFIDAFDFFCDDFGVLEAYLEEKFGVIILFIRRALSHRKKSLGIFSSPDEYDDSVITMAADREKLVTGMAALNWFLDAVMADDPEDYFVVNDLEVTTVVTESGEIETLSDVEMLSIDNERRPLK